MTNSIIASSAGGHANQTRVQMLFRLLLVRLLRQLCPGSRDRVTAGNADRLCGARVSGSVAQSR